jgi:hypothetical protein
MDPSKYAPALPLVFVSSQVVKYISRLHPLCHLQLTDTFLLVSPALDASRYRSSLETSSTLLRTNHTGSYSSTSSTERTNCCLFVRTLSPTSRACSRHIHEATSLYHRIRSRKARCASPVPSIIKRHIWRKIGECYATTHKEAPCRPRQALIVDSEGSIHVSNGWRRDSLKHSSYPACHRT